MPSPARTSSRVEQCLIAPQGTVHNKLHQNTLQLSFLYTAHTLTNTTTIRSTAPLTRARIQPALTTAPHHDAITVVRAGLVWAGRRAWQWRVVVVVVVLQGFPPPPALLPDC